MIQCNVQMEKSQYMKPYQFNSRNGRDYNCRSGFTGRFIDLNDMDFMPDNEISINTNKMIKEQDHLHVYKGAVDYMENKSFVIKVIKSITNLFRFF